MQKLYGNRPLELCAPPQARPQRSKWKVTIKGSQGATGADGLSAYQLAVKDGFNGTEKEWLASLAPPTLGELPDMVENWLKNGVTENDNSTATTSEQR